MLFNSFDFVVFLVTVGAAYFALPHRGRWPLLLCASCAFYMTFIPAYILILAAAITIDYFAGIWIEDHPEKRRYYLSLSVASVCAILFVFKYFNFFNSNVTAIAKAVHWNYPIHNLRIILPIGLSFHTFQSLSYVIEVYRGRQRAERHFGIYALYVMYFPQLVAGPIERPQNLLHQFRKPQPFDLGRIGDGLLLALWGLFKKVVVADCLAIYVNSAYGSWRHHSGSTLLLATYFFTFQIYCDFSGYSDIARGVSRAFGIELMQNFDMPYFSTSVADFWSRWHISLSTWFRDYVYIPLGGNRVSAVRHSFNLFVVFLISGFWHGANWTFIIWGALHGIWLIAEKAANAIAKYLPPLVRGAALAPIAARRALKLFVTFHLVLLSWVFFRADGLQDATGILGKILLDHGPLFPDSIAIQGAMVAALAIVLEAVYKRGAIWADPANWSSNWRAAFAICLVFAVVLFGVETGAQFIYFQF